MASDDSATVVFANIARDLAAQASEQAVLDRVSELATRLLPGCEDAGILLLYEKQEVFTASATSQRVRDSDAAQGRFQEGPCFDAARGTAPWHEQVYRSNDTTRETRWPEYMTTARELGVGSMSGYQLYASEEVFGAMDLYASQPGVFTDEVQRYGWVLASHAAVALHSARTDDQLRTAMETRQEIGQALGILRERYQLSEEAAFGVLQRASQHTHTKLRELAAELVRTGQLPDT